MANIYVFSIDYDGCLAGHGAIFPEMRALNERIHLILKLDPDAQVVLMVGSYRQSMANDAYNLRINRNGSCFPVYENILNVFKTSHPDFAHRISLDKFLLADIEEGKSSGTHFERAVHLSRMNPRKYQAVEASPEPMWHDETKCGLQYVQMHHLAVHFAHDTIKYYFHDNCDDLILKPSHEFFSQFNFCIPNNVTLMHFCYELGCYKKESLPIQGSGYIDFDYRENIGYFKGALYGPIPRLKISNTFRNVSIFAKHDEHLRLTLLRSHGRFFPFGQLIQIRGRESVDDFIAHLQNQSIEKEYNGYLLHLAVAQHNVDAAENLLRRGVNPLFRNKQGKDALECAVRSNNFEMIAFFLEYVAIGENDDHLLRFVSSMLNFEFYFRIDRLIDKKLIQSATVLLRYRVKEAAALSDYYIKTYLEIKNGVVHCTKKFFSGLMDAVVKNQRISSLVNDLHRFHFHTLILPGDHFEAPALQALCFFMDELKKKCEPIEELIFAILMLKLEIKVKMRLTTLNIPFVPIENHYQRFLGYQAVMKGKIKEELNDLHIVTDYIMSRSKFGESEIAAHLKKHHPDVSWLPLQVPIVKTPKQVILEAIRKQSNKNEGDKRVQAAFLMLQCVVAQPIALPVIVGLLDSWKQIKFYRASDTISDLLRNADDSACCFSFFSPKNVGFLTQLPATIEAVSRHS